MTADVISLREEPVPNTPVPRLELAEWRQHLGATAGITTSAGGFDLGLFGAGPAGVVMTNWLQFTTAMEPAFSRVALARQVHGSRIASHRVGNGWTVQDTADGHLTDDAGVLLAVTVADCVPVYLMNRRSGRMGLMHAGWKGIAAGVIEAGIARLAAPDGTAADIVMHCGVAICESCYEVDCEVTLAVEGGRIPGKRHLDLRQAAARRALAMGVPQVSVSTWCTAHDRGLFFSHRASGGAPGRMAAYLGRPLA